MGSEDDTGRRFSRARRNDETWWRRPVKPFQWTLLQPATSARFRRMQTAGPNSLDPPITVREACGKTALVAGKICRGVVRKPGNCALPNR
jgi:hypothetical protein